MAARSVGDVAVRRAACRLPVLRAVGKERRLTKKDTNKSMILVASTHSETIILSVNVLLFLVLDLWGCETGGLWRAAANSAATRSAGAMQAIAIARIRSPVERTVFEWVHDQFVCV